MSAIITVLYCPKCQSRDIKRERIEPQPQPVSMDDLATFVPVQVVPLVLHTYRWRATCNECSYFVEYESY